MPSPACKIAAHGAVTHFHLDRGASSDDLSRTNPVRITAKVAIA
jgi:hypothetical protein